MFGLSRPWLNGVLFGISEQQALFSSRGFQPASPDKQNQLETIGKTFIRGYCLALKQLNDVALAGELERVPPGLRGFAFEGAAMALGITDAVWRRSRFSHFLRGLASRHHYLLHVGLGWAWARIPWLRWNMVSRLESQDPLLGRLIIDGFGFHEGYFHWQSTIVERKRPRSLAASLYCSFDQGLGRSLWFFNGADTARTAACIADFPQDRRADLWSGVGLAATYAGGASTHELRQLHRAAGDYTAHLQQGAFFAAVARQAGGNMTGHTEQAIEALTGRDVEAAAEITDRALHSAKGSADPYEAWREGIRRRCGTFTELELSPP